MTDKSFVLQKDVTFGDNSFSVVKSKNMIITQSDIAIYCSSLVFWLTNQKAAWTAGDKELIQVQTLKTLCI